MEERNYRGAGEKVGICQVGPSADGEGSAGVLGLDRVCLTRDHQPLRKLREWSKRRRKALRRGHCLLPMSPSFLSSKSRKRFLFDISSKPLIVLSDQSSMISAWVLSTHM